MDVSKDKLSMGIFDNLDSDDYIFYGIIGVVILIVVILIAGGVYESFQPTFTLSKSVWDCTASHTDHTTTYVNNVPLTTDDVIYDRYEKRK